MDDLLDPDASQAVLIGSGTYKHLDDIPTVGSNLTALAALVEARTYWGLPSTSITIVEDVADHAEVARAVRVAAEKVLSYGLLFVYYVGHGLIQGDGSLVLGLKDTDPDRPDEHGVPFEWIRREVAASAARTKVVILDCCYAGRADADRLAADASDAVEVAVKADMDMVERSCLLVAAGRTSMASASDGAGHTAFTGAMLQVLRDGVDNGQPFLTVETIWQRVRAILAERGDPLPELRNRNLGGRVPFVHNARSSFRELAGRVLFSKRGITDPDLAENGLLVLRHDDTGALAVRLTTRLKEFPSDFTESWTDSVTELRGLYDGGPVAQDGFIAVARQRPHAATPRFTPITDRIGTIPLATPPEEINRCVGDLWIFAGYFGWRPGELEEYLRSGVLVRSAAPALEALRKPPHELWAWLLQQRDRPGTIDGG